MKSEVTQSIVHALKKEFVNADWWTDVQEDVRTRLEWVVNNITTVGIPFCKTYMSLFHWEHVRRRIEGKAVTTNPMAGYLTAIFGMKISEETYQCGVLPARAVLDLYDYINPNDADVTACMFLCNRIEQLEKIGVLNAKSSASHATSEEVARAFTKVIQKQPPKKQIAPINKTINWDFDDDIP